MATASVGAIELPIARTGMRTIDELLLSEPREDLSVEYKGWLDLSTNNGRATIAKAAIALANHGGGFIVLGFTENQNALVSQAKLEGIPPITQDAVNAAVRRYADPEFHVEVHDLTHPSTGIEHVVVSVPSVPVMSKRNCESILFQNRCYIRKPGPRSEEPQNGDEWRTLLNRCVRAQREDMLNAIRAIVTGGIEVGNAVPTAEEALAAFAEAAQRRWSDIVADLPSTTSARFPLGYYEMAFSLAGADPAASLKELLDRLSTARRIKLTGWSAFLAMHIPGLAPYPHEDFVEAWLGRPISGATDVASLEPVRCDFWRASRSGQLYTIRGYLEDSSPDRPPGTCMDMAVPVWRVGEGLLFATRLAETFEGVKQILVRCRFTGLKGRALVSIDNSRIAFGDSISRTNDVLVQTRATPAEVQDSLTELTLQLLTPLYERFDFFQLPISLVDQELQKLRHSRF
jgi:hypothetical protein